MNTGAVKTLRKLVVNTKEFLNLTDSRNFKARQLFFENQSTWPMSLKIETIVELSTPINRLKPRFASALPGHSAFWGHGMFPFSSVTYKSRALKIWSGTNVIVCGKKGGLLFDDGTYERSSFGFFPWDNTELCPKILTPGELEYDVSKALTVDTPAFMGFNGGHTNYAHWLTDHITMLDLYIDYFQSSGVKIVLPDNLTEFAKASIRLMGIQEHDILWANSRPLLFSDLRFVSIFAFNEIPLRFGKAVDRLLSGVDLSLVTARGPKRIFISRRDATARPFVNAQALEDIMTDLGYEIVVTGNMTLTEQIYCFRQADVVVGAHGAGLINSIFCQPGATLVEIFPEYMVQPHFWTASSLRGVNYGYVAGTSFDPDSANITAANAWASPSIAPIRELKAALSGL